MRSNERIKMDITSLLSMFLAASFDMGVLQQIVSLTTDIRHVHLFAHFPRGPEALGRRLSGIRHIVVPSMLLSLRPVLLS